MPNAPTTSINIPQLSIKPLPSGSDRDIFWGENPCRLLPLLPYPHFVSLCFIQFQFFEFALECAWHQVELRGIALHCATNRHEIWRPVMWPRGLQVCHKLVATIKMLCWLKWAFSSLLLKQKNATQIDIGNEGGTKESGRPCVTYHIEQMLNDLPVTLICWDARQ